MGEGEMTRDRSGSGRTVKCKCLDRERYGDCQELSRWRLEANIVAPSMRRMNCIHGGAIILSSLDKAEIYRLSWSQVW